MVAIKANQVEHFLKAPPTDICAFLIYGPDKGLANERSRFLSKALLTHVQGELEQITIGDDDFAMNPTCLANELNSFSMFSSHKIIRASNNSRLRIDAIKSMLTAPLEDAHLILEAGDLKKTAAIRKFFEKTKHCAAIPCFADNQRSIAHLIDEVIKNHDLTIDANAKQLLASRLGADRALSRNELEKLTLYCAKETNITVQHIEDLIEDNSALEANYLIAQTLGGKTALALNSFERLLLEGTNPAAILILLNAHLNRLLSAAFDLDQGKSMEQTLAKQRPPLFYDRKDQFIDQLRRWPLADLKRLYFKAHQIMKDTRMRNNSDMAHLEIERLILSASAQAAHVRR